MKPSFLMKQLNFEGFSSLERFSGSKIKFEEGNLSSSYLPPFPLSR
jgi:hypothetical protein